METGDGYALQEGPSGVLFKEVLSLPLAHSW